MDKNEKLPIINFETVSKVYPGGIVALNEISFKVDPGEFSFIVGPSGAGKSTIIRLLIKQEQPTDGLIHFEDLNVTSIPRKLLSLYRQQLGIVFQDLKLIPSKTVRENIQFALEITNRRNHEINETTNYLLDIVNLKGRAHLFPDELSGGEKQRVAIARALANDPKLLIADEPTGNLDQENAEEIMSILDAINGWGTTVMVITHDNGIVDRMKKRVLRLNQGKLVSDEGNGMRKASEEKKKPTFLQRLNEKAASDDDSNDVEISPDKKHEEDISDFLKAVKKQDKKLYKMLKHDKLDDIEKVLDMTDEELKKKGYKEKHLEELEKVVKNYYNDK